jgi:hypothetical protein
MALAALDWVGDVHQCGNGCTFSRQRSRLPSSDAPPAGLPPLEEVERPQAMASPSYGIDAVALAVAVALAAAIVLLASQVVPDLTDLMMMPPPLSGVH